MTSLSSRLGVTRQIFSCRPRTPEAICQFQLASRVRRALVTRSNASNGGCWPCVRVWARARGRSLTGRMIDATFRLRQIVHINLAGQKAFKHSGIHELTRLSAFITGGRIAISNHWTHTHTHRSTRMHEQPQKNMSTLCKIYHQSGS